jgi:uncharacterized integral membrane protein
MLSIVFAIIIIAVVAAFSVQNAAPIVVSFLFWRFEASLAIVIFLSALSGMLTGMVVMSWSRRRRSLREKKAPEEKTVGFK